MRERAVRPDLGTSPSATVPSPHPSGFRPRIGVRGMLLIAGMTNRGAGVTNGMSLMTNERLSGTVCFHSNRSCRLVPAHQGMKIGCIGWWESSSVIATTRTSPLDSRLRRNDELGGRNDEIAEWRGSTARSKAA